MRCYRYFQKIENTANGTEYFGMMQAYGTGVFYGIVKDYVITMREKPHTVTSGGTFGVYQANSGNGGSTTGISRYGNTNFMDINWFFWFLRISCW